MREIFFTYLPRFAKRLDIMLVRFEKTVITVGLILMILLVFFDFMMRELFNSGIPGAQKLALYLMLWVGFLGSSLATRDGKHLSMDLMEKFLSGRIRQIVEAIVWFLTMLFCLFLARVGLNFVIQNFRYGDPPLYYGIPEWAVQSVIPLAMFVMAVRFFGKFLKTVYGSSEKAKENIS